MSRELSTRQARGRRLCERLAAVVASIAPDGLGQTEETWAVVDPPSADFLDALVRWETTGDEAATDQLAKAYAAVVQAWKDAAARYREPRP